MARVLTLFESAIARARVVRHGLITQFILDGGGAMVMESSEFNAAAKWAQSKTATGNPLTDRGRLLDRITVVISRPGSIVSTRGSDKQLTGLAKLMIQAGYDLAEWQLPPELRNMRQGGDVEQEEKNAAKARERRRIAEGGAVPPDDAPPPPDT